MIGKLVSEERDYEILHFFVRFSHEVSRAALGLNPFLAMESIQGNLSFGVQMQQSVLCFNSACLFHLKRKKNPMHLQPLPAWLYLQPRRKIHLALVQT